MVGKILFIEGSSETKNGNLRKAFGKLLEQKLKGNMPRIKMGDDKHKTLDFYNNYDERSKAFVLIDLDEDESKKNEQLKQSNLSVENDNVYFMIQEMEAWFISQSNILISYFGNEVENRIPKGDPKKITKPSQVLYEIAKDTKRKKYHKVRDAEQLLQLLDANQLCNDFEDFKNLVDELSKNYIV